ncbi:hypothetical protein [Cecembia lonarensis]|uniref:Uncharacterized protein n=1 Tax=Cecembia lonarensis (strain CCUG 58316 / KCTC 22772 / LW9) TaxID=1225176 RepID=K1LW11_CECL9|nr:hypothetical protein [Cecembia lonarensis]EKB48319.1 hypothetical protein B879_03050 [Cecembia lonarensis LW9]
MQKFLIIFILTALTVLFIGPYVPFWVLMLIVVLICYFTGAGAGSSFLSAGLSFGLVWFFMVIKVLISSNSDLPVHMADLMGLKNDNLLWFSTALLGFLIGGFSAMTGALLKKLFQARYEGVYRR